MPELVIALIALASAGAPPQDIDRYMPCAPGLVVEYVSRRGEEIVAKIEERVIGPGEERHTCVLERKTVFASGRRDDERWAREHLPDRISHAGSVDMPLAFRPPLLFAPIAEGKTWRFNTTEYRIASASETVNVRAGTFRGCVRVAETAPGGHAAENVYAPGVGLVLSKSGELTLEATRVIRPRK